MKNRTTNIIAGFLILLACTLSGCFSTNNLASSYADFARKIPAAKITDLSTTTQSPLWTFNASASGISTDPQKKTITIVNGKMVFSIPLWGFAKTFSVSGLEFAASADQISNGLALQAAAAAPATTDTTPR